MESNNKVDLKDDPNKSINVSKISQWMLSDAKWKRGSIFVPFQFGGPQFKTPQEKLIDRTVESCTIKAVLSGAIGFGLGALLGIFSASVGPDLSMTAEPEKFKFSQYLKEMKGKILSHGKSFAVLGLMFSFSECTIESVCFDFKTIKIIIKSIIYF